MNRINKKLIALFCIVFLLPIFGFVIVPKPNEITLFFSLPKWDLISQKNGTSELHIQDWISYPNVQGYLLPRKLVKIQIPWEYEYADLTIRSSEQKVSSEKVLLTKVKDLSIINSKGVVQTSLSGNNPGLLTYISTVTENATKQVLLVVCPFYFDASNNQLSYIASFRLTVSLKKTEISKLNSISADIPSEEKYNYCIILPKAKVPLFQDYKSFWEDRGIRTVLFPLEEIYATYKLSNNPNNIRTFIKDFYLNHGIETVLLVGTIGTIPMKQFYPTGNKNEEPILSDLYYSELTTSWDENPYPGKLEIDLKDFDPEIAIGRLPMDSDQEITDYLSRILNYYQTIDQRKKSILCAGAWISFQEDDGIIFRSDMFDIDGGKMAYKKYQTYFPTYSYEGFFEQEGKKKSQVAQYGNSINYTNIKGAIWQTNPLIQLLSGHGNHTAIYRKIWNSDKNENGIAEADEISYDPFYDENSPSSASLYLVDSCSTCLPNKTNLGMQTIKKTGGGYLGFASEVYFIVSSACKDPCDFENSTSIYGITGVAAKYLNQQLSIGESTKKSLKHYRDLCFVSLNQTITQYQAKNIFATCYYGDPYIKLSGYPLKDWDTFISQGKSIGTKSAFGIGDVSISNSSQFDKFKIKSLETLKNGRNYLFTISIDSNKDQQFDYVFKIGFQKPDNYIQNLYQNDQFKSIYGHYGFRYDENDFWIQIPRSILGKAYRYQILLTNIETNLSDTFLESFPKEETTPKPPENKSPPSPPLNLTATLNEGRVHLNWIASSVGAFPLLGYEIYRQESEFDYAIIGATDHNMLTFVDQFVIGGKTYLYKVRTFDNQVPKNYSSFSNIVIVTLPKVDNPPKQILPPTAPSITKLLHLNSQVYLSWLASVPGSFPIAGYEIFRQENADQYVLITMIEALSLQMNDQFVSSGNSYTYKIRCFDNQSPPNFSVFSTEQFISIPKSTRPKDPESPTILSPSPPLLKGELIKDSFLNQLSWSKSLEGTFPIIGYELYRKNQTSEMALYKKLDAFTNNYFDTQIEENNIYTYYVLAIDNQTPPHKSMPSNYVSIQVPEKIKPSLTIRLKIGSNIAIVGDRFLVLPIEPFTYKDRTMVPIRFIGEAFGAKVNWTEDESKNGEGIIEIYLLKSDKTELFIAFHTLETKALYRVYKNGGLVKDQVVQMDVPAFIVKPANRTVVPLRFIAETFDADVKWDEKSEEISIEFSP